MINPAVARNPNLCEHSQKPLQSKDKLIRGNALELESRVQLVHAHGVQLPQRAPSVVTGGQFNGNIFA